MHEWHGKKPASLAGYLEAMSFAIFTVGISWKVVDAKWEGLREAFAGFDVETVAALTPPDIDRLVEDRRVIRNRRKIEAIVDNANKLLELDEAPGGFAGYLSAIPDFGGKVVEMKRNFAFLGDSSARYFLAAVGEPWPEGEECGFVHGAAGKASAS